MVVLAAVIGLIVGFILAWIFASARRKPVIAKHYEMATQEAHRTDNVQLEAERNRAEAKLEEERQRAFNKGRDVGRKEAASHFKVHVIPFYKKGHDWNPLKKPVYDYGYRYQLFNEGKPCFQESEVVLGRIAEKEMNPGDLEHRVKSELDNVLHDGNNTI